MVTAAASTCCLRTCSCPLHGHERWSSALSRIQSLLLVSARNMVRIFLGASRCRNGCLPCARPAYERSAQQPGLSRAACSVCRGCTGIASAEGPAAKQRLPAGGVRRRGSRCAWFRRSQRCCSASDSNPAGLANSISPSSARRRRFSCAGFSITR